MNKEVSTFDKKCHSLYDICFLVKYDPEMIKSYFKTYFNFIPKNDFSLLTFYNYFALPFYISEQTYNGFFHKKLCITRDDLVNVLTDFYFGNSEKRSELIFGILDNEQQGKLNINNVINVFNGFINVDKSFTNQAMLEDMGKDVIKAFFAGKEEMTVDEYKKTLQESNSDLFFLFYMFYRHYAFFAFTSVEHYKNKFYANSKVTKVVHEHSIKNTLIRSTVGDECVLCDTRAYSEKTHYFFILSPPSDALLDFLNKKFNYDFDVDSDLKELETFEGEFKELRACMQQVSDSFKNKKMLQMQKKLKTDTNLAYVYPRDFMTCGDDTKRLKGPTISKKSNNTVPHLYSKACVDVETLLTFKVEWLSGEVFSPYSIDIIANDVYIYNMDKQLKLLFPIQHLYIETNDPVVDNKRFPLSLYSELNNNLKQCVLYFMSVDEREHFITVIIQRTKYDTFDKTRFDNQTLIDSGSFGQIIQAYDKILQREVAIKLINKPRNNRETIKMIRNEQDICQFLQSARCDGIVEIFEINETKDSVYIIEELVKNGNLKDYLLLNRLSEKEKVTIIRQLATTIQFLHRNGIVHRDLKLENVLIDKTETNGVSQIQTKVIDFGLSTFFLGNPNMKDKYGTLLYLPPEIVLSHTYTKKLDIWDFGLIAYTVLNDGEHPFGKETEVQALLQKIIHRDVDYQHIDKKFHSMLNGCLQKESQRKDIEEIIAMIDQLGIVWRCCLW